MAWREDAHIKKLKVESLYLGSPASWTAMSRTAAQMNLLVQGVVAGYKIARGNVAATAAATVATGLSTVVDFVTVPRANSATQANYCVLATGKKSTTAGSIILYRWKHTSAGTTTLVAATTAGTLEWVAVGT